MCNRVFVLKIKLLIRTRKLTHSFCNGLGKCFALNEERRGEQWDKFFTNFNLSIFFSQGRYFPANEEFFGAIHSPVQTEVRRDLHNFVRSSCLHQSEPACSYGHFCLIVTRFTVVFVSVCWTIRQLKIKFGHNKSYKIYLDSWIVFIHSGFIRILSLQKYSCLYSVVMQHEYN